MTWNGKVRILHGVPKIGKIMNDVQYAVFYCYMSKPQVIKTTSLNYALEVCSKFRTDPNCSFVTMTSENKNCTSLPGAAVATEYDWKKRR